MITLPNIDNPWIWAFCLNSILIAFAQRFPLLTPSGWFHAGVLGTILWGCLGWSGWLVVVIYLALGSLVTRLGFARKQLDGLAEGRGGKCQHNLCTESSCPRLFRQMPSISAAASIPNFLNARTKRRNADNP